MITRAKNARRHCIVAALACFTLGVASAQTVFTKVADSTMAFPGAPGGFNFSSFGAPAIHAGVVAFEASASSFNGVFRWTNGVLQKAADNTTAVPNGTGSFFFFSGGFATYTENGTITFRGINNTNGQGFYQFDGTSLTRLADSATPNPIPGGSGPFAQLFGPAMKDGQIAFIAANTNLNRGIFVISNGVFVERLAPGTAYPGGLGVMGFSSQVGFDDGNLAFWSSDASANTNHSIFTLVGNTLTRVAQKNVTLAPGAGTPFTSLSSPPDVSGTKVAFAGSFTGGSGIYSANLDGSGLAKLVDNSTAIPEGSGNFTSFGGFEYDGGDLVFYGIGATGGGIYRLREGVLSRVIDSSAPLDGKGVASFTFRDAGYANGEIAFSVNFNNGSRGIYTANLGGAASPTSGGKLSGFAFSPSSGASFTFGEASSGKPYRIQSSTTLASNDWSDLTNFNFTAPIVISDPAAAGQPRKFYRAITP